jgi:DNA primase catalytic core
LIKDLDLVRHQIKDRMPLNEFIIAADLLFKDRTGRESSQLERVNDNLYRKNCDLDSHPVDSDGSKDSTPSFTVSPNKEMFYCFGCGVGGDRFEYLSQKFNIDHIAAIRLAAEIVGLDLKPYESEITEEDKVKNTLFAETDKARQVGNTALMMNTVAMEYLKNRGITEESIIKYKIGYSANVNQWSSFPNAYALEFLRNDKMTDSILFPVTDSSGNMRYFQSRPFTPVKGMKYIGASESHPLYDSVDRIFGFSEAKKELHNTGGNLVGVEGAPDAIALMQVGIPACAVMGTAVNQKTFDLLERFRIVEFTILLDGDKAGIDRSFKIAEKYLGLKTKVRLRVASIDDNTDPDEYIIKHGANKIRNIINKAPYAIEYLINTKWAGATTPTEKIGFLNTIKPYIAGVNDKVVHGIMITHIASLTGLDPVQIEDFFIRASVDQAGAKLFSLEGEEILLGEALRNSDFISDLMMRFKKEDWHFIKHRQLFGILIDTDYHDIDTIYQIVKNKNLDSTITESYLQGLYSKYGNIEFSLMDIEDKLIRRKSIEIIDKAKIAMNDMTKDAVISLDQTTNEVFQTVHKAIDEKVFDAKIQSRTVMNLIHERMKNGNRIIGYSFGNNFEKLDLATLGIQTKSLNVLAANQSVGKTLVAQNWALYHSMVLNIPTLWFSLEMDYTRMTFRHLSILSGVQSTNIMTGNLTLEEKSLVDNAAIKLEHAPFFLSEKGHDLSESLAIARRYIMRHNIKIVYVDYAQLQYVTDRRTDQRHRELGWISKAWKQMAQDMDVAVILISQLSKAALDADIAHAEHGAGSYEIAQDADVYITLKRRTSEEIQLMGAQYGNIIMNVDKNRQGEREVLINIFADFPIQTASECNSLQNAVDTQQNK